MVKNSSGQRLFSLILLAGGIVLMAMALIMDFSGNQTAIRGPLLVIGMVSFFIGLYIFPTLKNHRRIVYIIFLFPLLFTFAVIVTIKDLVKKRNGEAKSAAV